MIGIFVFERAFEHWVMESLNTNSSSVQVADTVLSTSVTMYSKNDTFVGRIWFFFLNCQWLDLLNKGERRLVKEITKNTSLKLTKIIVTFPLTWILQEKLRVVLIYFKNLQIQEYYIFILLNPIASIFCFVVRTRLFYKVKINCPFSLKI